MLFKAYRRRFLRLNVIFKLCRNDKLLWLHKFDLAIATLLCQFVLHFFKIAIFSCRVNRFPTLATIGFMGCSITRMQTVYLLTRSPCDLLWIKNVIVDPVHLPAASLSSSLLSVIELGKRSWMDFMKLA